MLKAFSVILLTTLLVACATPGQSSSDRVRQSYVNLVNTMADTTSIYLKEYTEVQAIASAQEAVKTSLKDPNSAQFKNVRFVPFGRGKVICGEINAKNSYGGYVGFKRFVASPISAVIERTGSRYAGDADDLANTGLNAACRY